LLGIVRDVQNCELPTNFELPSQMRSKNTNKNCNLIGWHIVDYNTWQRKTTVELSKEQMKLSPWDTWNDTLLIERLSSGWTLENWK